MKNFKKIIDGLAAEARKHEITLPAGDVLPADMDAHDLAEARHAFVATARAVLASMKVEDTEQEFRRLERLHMFAMHGFESIRNEEELRGLGSAPFNPQRPVGEETEARGDGGEVYRAPATPRWRDENGAEVRVVSKGEAFAKRKHSGPGVGEITRALIFGPQSDAERRALSEGTDSAGGYTVPEPLVAAWIDRLRAQSVVMQAGARTVEMSSETLAMARLETDPTVAWRNENAAIGDSDPTFGRVTLQAHSLMGLVKFSRELLQDSLNVAEMVENAAAQACALELDRACLFGSGTAPEPRGVFNVAGINSTSMGTNGATPTNYDDLIDAIYEQEVDNAGTPSAFIWHPRTKRTYAKLKDADGNPLNVPADVAAVRKLTTTAVPIDQTQGTAVGVCSTILSGDFSQLLVGFRLRMTIGRLVERFADYNQVAIVFGLRADCAVTNPVHFNKLIGVKA